MPVLLPVVGETLGLHILGKFNVGSWIREKIDRYRGAIPTLTTRDYQRLADLESRNR